MEPTSDSNNCLRGTRRKVMIDFTDKQLFSFGAHTGLIIFLQNLYHKQNHEFETLSAQVRILKSCEKQSKGKMIEFTDFSQYS